MLIAHQGRGPKVDPSAWVAPNAVLCGDVTLGPGTRIAHGAQVIAEVGGSIALGDPAKILPPDRHDEIWALQEPLDFPGTVYGVARGTPDLMRQVTERLSERLGPHRGDEVL